MVVGGGRAPHSSGYQRSPLRTQVGHRLTWWSGGGGRLLRILEVTAEDAGRSQTHVVVGEGGRLLRILEVTAEDAGRSQTHVVVGGEDDSSGY